MHACQRVNVNENLQLAQKASAFGPFGPTNAQKPEERPVQKAASAQRRRRFSRTRYREARHGRAAVRAQSNNP